MSTARRDMVSSSLAHYLGLGQSALRLQLELRADLGLEPLDLVLFLLALEQTDGLSFPVEELEQATTVGDLVKVVSGWLEDYDRRELAAAEEDAAFEDRRRPLESGTWATSQRRRASGES